MRRDHPSVHQPLSLYYVINPFRPWPATLEHIDKVLGETLGVSYVEPARLRLLGNPNLGPGTTPAEVAVGAQQLVDMVGPYKPVDFLTVRKALCPDLPEGLPMFDVIKMCFSGQYDYKSMMKLVKNKGGLRVLRGEEKAKTFVKNQNPGY